MTRTDPALPGLRAAPEPSYRKFGLCRICFRSERPHGLHPGRSEGVVVNAMKTSDPLSDLFTRLRNGMRAGHEHGWTCRASRLKEAVLKVLEQEGFVSAFRKKSRRADGPVLRVGLKYDHEGEPIVAGLERVSRPGTAHLRQGRCDSRRCWAAWACRSCRRRGAS
jgi:ribosomal protein S8